jgi:hypothetical protein
MKFSGASSKKKETNHPISFWALEYDYSWESRTGL